MDENHPGPFMTLMTTPYSFFFAQMAKDFRLPQYLGSIVHTPTNNRFGMKGHLAKFQVSTSEGIPSKS